MSEFTVVRNEFERGENNPQGVLFQRIMAAAYEWHNYGKTTIGNRTDIETSSNRQPARLSIANTTSPITWCW